MNLKLVTYTYYNWFWIIFFNKIEEKKTISTHTRCERLNNITHNRLFVIYVEKKIQLISNKNVLYRTTLRIFESHQMVYELGSKNSVKKNHISKCVLIRSRNILAMVDERKAVLEIVSLQFFLFTTQKKWKIINKYYKKENSNCWWC